MTDLLNDVDATSDAELISRVRGGDVASYGDLFARHVEAAKRLSRQLVRGPDADDLVSEAFAKVLGVLQGGGGPDVAFRAYLLTAVRRLHIDRVRSGARLQSSDDMEAFDPGVPFQDTAVAAFESGAAAKAFASLPERWQLVLWHLEVEGQKPADVAPLLGMSPNSVSALAYRAREGLRQAFLTMHLSDISETDCRWVNEHLGAYVRNGLAKRESTRVGAHLEECRRCTAMYLELTEVNANLRGIIAPLLLGAAAAGYLSSTGVAAGGLGITALFGRVRDAVSANAGVAGAGAVAAGIAAVATAAIVLLPSSSPDEVIGADDRVGTVSQSPDPGGSSGSDPDSDPDSDKGDREGAQGADSSATEPAEPAGADQAALLPSALPSPDDGTDGDPSSDSGPPSDQSPDDGQGSSEPTPTEPTPTEPTPTEPTPTEPPVSYTLQVNRSSIEDGAVIFDLSGDPLPPTVYLQIESPPAGISFDPEGSGTCVRVDPLLARCSTTPESSSVLGPLARAMVLALDAPTQVSMPFSGAPEVDTDVTIALSAPMDTVWDRVTLRYAAPQPAPEPDLSLTGFPTQVTPTNVHHYSVTGQLGVVDHEDDIVLTVSDPDDRARFADGEVPQCQEQSPTTLVCPAGFAGDIALPLFVQDNREDTTVTITVSPVDGSADSDTSNDSVTITLQRFRPAATESAAATRTSTREPASQQAGSAKQPRAPAQRRVAKADLPVEVPEVRTAPRVRRVPDGATATATATVEQRRDRLRAGRIVEKITGLLR